MTKLVKFWYKFMHMVIGVVVNEVGVERIKRNREMEVIREVTRAIYR